MGPHLHPQEGASSDRTEERSGKTPNVLKGMKNYRQPGLRGDTALPRALHGASSSSITLQSIQIIICLSACFFLNFPLKKSFWLLGRKPQTPSLPLPPTFGGVSACPQDVLHFGPPTSRSFPPAHAEAQLCRSPQSEDAAQGLGTPRLQTMQSQGRAGLGPSENLLLLGNIIHLTF